MLERRMDIDFKFTPEVITTYCVVHNFCKRERVAIPQEVHVRNEYPVLTSKQQVAREADGEAKVMQQVLINYMVQPPLQIFSLINRWFCFWFTSLF